MKRAVIDASVIIAGLMADGATRNAIKHTRVELWAPPVLLLELGRHRDRLATHTKVSVESVDLALAWITDRVEVAPAEVLIPFSVRARTIAEEADAAEDEDYIALALALQAPIWTFERDFERMSGIELIRSIPLDPLA